jgi:hypothetical protein
MADGGAREATLPASEGGTGQALCDLFAFEGYTEDRRKRRVVQGGVDMG